MAAAAAVRDIRAIVEVAEGRDGTAGGEGAAVERARSHVRADAARLLEALMKDLDSSDAAAATGAAVGVAPAPAAGTAAGAKAGAKAAVTTATWEAAAQAAEAAAATTAAVVDASAHLSAGKSASEIDASSSDSLRSYSSLLVAQDELHDELSSAGLSAAAEVVPCKA